MTFYVGDERVRAESSAWAYGPRGVPHGFEAEGEAPPGCYFSTPWRASSGSHGGGRTSQVADPAAC